MLGQEINMLAVATATLMSMALGIIWYSPMVCGRFWMKAVGVTEEDISSVSIARGWRFVLGFTVHFFVLASIAYLLRIARDVADASFLTLMICISVLMSAAYVSAVIWEKKHTQYLLVAGGYTLLFVWVGAGIIEYWPW